MGLIKAGFGAVGGVMAELNPANLHTTLPPSRLFLQAPLARASLTPSRPSESVSHTAVMPAKISVFTISTQKN